MPRKITTLDGLQAELWKLVGDRGQVSAGVNFLTSHSPGYRGRYEYWSARIVIEDADGNRLVAVDAGGDSAGDCLLKVKAKVRDALTERARRRHVEHRPPRLEGMRRLEYHGGGS